MAQGLRRSLPALALFAASAGCQFITSVDRTTLGETGGGSPTGAGTGGGLVFGIGGTSDSGGTPNDASSIDMDASGTGGSSGAAGSGGSAGSSESGTTGSGGIVAGSGGSVGTGGGVTSDAPLSDAAPDSSISPCVRALPAGWTLVAFSPTAASCPAGYVDHAVLSGSGTLGPTACTCGCTVSQPGTCQGTLSVSVAPGQGVDTCTVTLTSGAAVNGSNCIQAATPRVESALATFSGNGQGGSCTDSTTPNSSQLTKPPAQHYCDVPAANSDAVCNGTAPAGFSACIARTGTQTCPAPFTRVSYPVEDDLALNCSACTGCAVTTTCAAGTVNLFGDGNCATSVGSAPANNACVVLNGGNEVAVGSVSYSASATQGCTSGTSAASTTAVTPRTICCR